MKILFLTPYVPVPPTYGGALRIYHLLRGLAKKHEVTLLAFGGEKEKRLLDNLQEKLFTNYHLIPVPFSWKHRRLAQLYAFLTARSFFLINSEDRRMQKKIDELLLKNKYDIVQTEFPIMGGFNFNTTAVKILDEHNVEYDNLYGMWKYATSPLIKMHYNREYKKAYVGELKACKKMNALFVVSERDKGILEKETPGLPKFLVPNGVDSSYFKPSDRKTEPYSIVFTGMMGYIPNHDGMHYFLDEIFPLILKKIPKAKVYIVGNKPPESLVARASDNVIVTGFVDDVRDYVWRSSLYVVPLRTGGGTRLKVLEALAMKKPVVSTTIGCSGIDVENGKSIYIEDEPQKFADKCVDVLLHPEVQNALIENGYNLVKSNYDWHTISQKMENNMQTLVFGNSKVYDINLVSEKAV